MRLGKRGMDDKIYFLIWELIALMIVTVLLVMAVSSIANNTKYWKKYYSQDLALMTDIENINQGDFVMNYVTKQTDDSNLKTIYMVDNMSFEFLLAKDHIEVYDAPRKKESVPTIFPYGANPDVYPIVSPIHATFLVLSKAGSELRLSDHYSKDMIRCPAYSTRQQLSESTRFDVIALNDSVSKYAAAASSVLGQFGKSTQAKPILTILIAPSPDDTLKVYYSNGAGLKKSEKYSCMLSKYYSEKYLADTSYVPYDGSYSNNTAFMQYMDKRSAPENQSIYADEYWILVSVPLTNDTISDIDFAAMIQDVTNNYYK